MSLYYCDSCGTTIHDVKSPSSIRLAEVWISGAAKTFISVENEKYRYFHKACFEAEQRKKRGGEPQSTSLF